MPITVIAGSLVEVLAAISFSGFSLVLFLVILNYYDFRGYVKCRHLREEKREAHLVGEQRKLILATWLIVNVVTAVLLSVFFAEIYEAEDDVDSAPLLLSLFVVQQFAMMMWVLMQSVWCSSTTRWPYLWLLGTMAVAIIETALVFTTLHESHWYHG